MPKTLRRLEIDIRKLVLDDMRRQVPFAETQRKVTALIADADLPKHLTADLMRDAERQYSWIADRTMSAADRATVEEIFHRAEASYARIGDAINDRVVKAIQAGLRESLPLSELENVVASAVRGTRGNAGAITETALGGVDRANHFHQAESSGLDLYYYSGPPAERQFCIHQLELARAGRLYTRAQIQGLSNGHGLPCDTYAGGWRCHHWWEVYHGAFTVESGIYRRT